MKFLMVILFCGFVLPPQSFAKSADKTAKKEYQLKPRIFSDVVYKIKDEGEKYVVTFRRAAAIYEVAKADKKILERLQVSKKKQKKVQVTADVQSHRITDVQGP